MRMKLKVSTRLLRFKANAETCDDCVIHVADGPIDDRTLCGIAHEGLGRAGREETFKHWLGRYITCQHCIAIIRLCRAL